MLMRALSVHIAHETAGAARIRHSLRPLISEGEEYLQTSGAMCREIADTHSVVIARLDRATQYSRDASDRTEKPQRTGCPPSRGMTALGGAALSPVIAMTNWPAPDRIRRGQGDMPAR